MQGLASGGERTPGLLRRSLTRRAGRSCATADSEKRPSSLKMDFALWTRAAVMLLIEHECGVKMGVRGVGKY